MDLSGAKKSLKIMEIEVKKKHVWTKDDLLNWLFVCFIAVKYSLNYLNYVSSIMCLVLRIQIFFQPLVITTYPLKLSSACLDEFFYVLIRCLIFDRASKPGSSRILADYWACHVIYQLKISSTNVMLRKPLQTKLEYICKVIGQMRICLRL